MSGTVSDPVDVPREPSGLRAAVITCSDSAANGAATDTSGPLATELLQALAYDVGPVTIVADDAVLIGRAVRHTIAAGARIVVLTGGTGAGPRDVTPEALRSAGLRELPGLGEAIRAASRVGVPTTDLSRTLGGILDGAVVLALPGSPGGVRDGLDAVGGLLEHAAQMAAGGGHGGGAHRLGRWCPALRPRALGGAPTPPVVDSDVQMAGSDRQASSGHRDQRVGSCRRGVPGRRGSRSDVRRRGP